MKLISSEIPLQIGILDPSGTYFGYIADGFFQLLRRLDKDWPVKLVLATLSSNP